MTSKYDYAKQFIGIDEYLSSVDNRTATDESLSVQDRAWLLVESHREWIELEAEALHDDTLVAGDEPMSFDEMVGTITYGYLECAASPLRDVGLFPDELDPDTFIYTADFIDAVGVAIEKVLS